MQRLVSVDSLQFPEYSEKHTASVEKLDQNDSVIGGIAQLDGIDVSTAISDFTFMGGSMGSVAGEIITRALERGAEQKMPVIIFCASGGARMQEGLLSLMQMAKTTAGVHKCREVGVPFIAVFTDPTMAGVLASYASIADVIIAEPRCLIGFAGARVSKQAQVVKAPDDFQTAEFVFRSGMLDRIVERREMRGMLTSLVSMFGAHLREREPMANSWKEWERPLLDLEDGVLKLKHLAARELDPAKKAALEKRIEDFEERIRSFIEVKYSRLGPWKKCFLLALSHALTLSITSIKSFPIFVS
ncbi:MAG: acetyl-CoA carboxylase carboxyltransferase subunit beta [Fimbriimonadaceae bacterium]